MDKNSILKRLFEEKHITFDELMILSNGYNNQLAINNEPKVQNLNNPHITWRPFQEQGLPNFPTMS